MHSLTPEPVKTTRRDQSEYATSDRSYRRHVEQPTALYFRLVVGGWASAGIAGVLLIGVILRAYTSLFILLVGVVAAALSVGCFYSIQHNKQLRLEYLALVKRTTTTQQDVRAVVSAQREIQVNGIPGAMVVYRDNKTLEGVTIQGKWLEAIEDSLNDGKTRLTRDMSGTTGRTFPAVREAFSRAGYLGEGNEINKDGQEWVRAR